MSTRQASPHRTRSTSTKIIELMEKWYSQMPKKGEGCLFQEFLQVINQPLLESEVQQSFFNAPVTLDQEKFAGKNAGHGGEEKATSSSAHVQKVTTVQDGIQNAGQDAIKMVESVLTMCSPPPFVLDSYSETNGPIFDMPWDTGFTSSFASVNCSSNLSLAYGIEDTEHRIRQKKEVKVRSVPSLKNATRMTGQRKENNPLDQMVEELNWTEEMTGYDKVPKWPQAGSGEINAPAAHLSNKVIGNNSPSGNINFGSRETVPDVSLRAERRSSPLKRLSRGIKDLGYREENHKNGNPFETSSQEKLLEEKRQIVRCENENFNPTVVGPCRNENQLEGGGSFCYYHGNEDRQPLKRARNYITSQEAGCSDPLLATQRSVRMASPFIPSQKFSCPSAPDARSNSDLEGPAYELAEGEIADPGADPLLPVLPNPDCLNSPSADVEDIAINATEPSRGSRGITSQYTRRPITSDTRMSAIIQRKCKSVISELQRRINEEGHATVPHLAYLCNISASSCFMINMAGINLLDFQKISLLLDGAKYNRIIDFLADIQSMFEGTAQQFGFSHEMRSEVDKVQGMFFDIMKTAFPDISIHEARLDNEAVEE